jgi:cyclophilin family peptidyl-prolyl cis-trans isomerase
MDRNFKKFLILFSLLFIISCKAQRGNENTIVSINTTLGNIKIKLYDETPVHRDNFIRLVKSGFYDDISFHRIIKSFMIQAGDPSTKTNIQPNSPDSLKSYTIPAEFNNKYFHKKGALAAARQSNDINPQMRSSGTQFYIVEGVTLNDYELNQSEQRINSNLKQTRFNEFMSQVSDSLRKSGQTLSDAEIQQIASVKMYNYLSTYKDYKISDEQRNVYKTLGGTPRLDGTYTVFGEVVEGLSVVDKIAEAATDSNDKPLNDIKILKIKIVKN